MSQDWNAANLTSPHTVADKRLRVQRMFSAIAPKYDLNNRLHSFGRDRAWRLAAVRMAEVKIDDDVVDVACGTGDLSMAFAPDCASVLGIDFTYAMLPLACRKSADLNRFAAADAGPPIYYVNGDAQYLPLPDACCDIVSIAFGIRNVQDVDAALREFHRVLRPGGRVVVLEFSEPRNWLIRKLNQFYCGQIMPRTATWLSGDRSGAYHYLPRSIETFLTRRQMVDHLKAAGFGDVRQKAMTLGVCICYAAAKAVASA